MATNRSSIILFVALMVAAIASSVTAKEFIVGDDKGWTLNFDYQAWAYGKKFVVGDKLIFNYAAGKHNVFRVNGTVFQQCMIPPVNEALTSGYDVITLQTTGRKWYICGVGKHCEQGGMKLFITVFPQSTPPPAPWVSPVPSSSKVFVVGDDKGWTLNFDYQAWAKGKQFFVGDKLVFRYAVGKHNVFRVNGTSFQQCTIPAATEALTSGYDVITLETPGRKWYICGVGKHCLMGLKLFINVLPLSTYPPPPYYGARKLAPPKF
ncbi:hypothetical protein Lser_V15G27710 [Lactuca serriola]